MNHRLLVGRIASEIRLERLVLAALAAPLVDPQTLDPGTQCVYCHHPLGAHEWPGDKCNFGGCRCRLFVVPKGGPVETPHEHDPLADLEEPPADPLAGLDEPPADEPAPAEPPEKDPPVDARPVLKAMLDDSGIFGQPVEIVRRTGTSPLHGRPLDDDGAIAFDALSRPVGAPESDAVEERTHTPVYFPVVIQGAPGVAIEALSAPARRVAEIVEALEPVLLPPSAVAGLEDLLTQAAALTAVTDADSHARACELYEQLAANGKALETIVGPVKAFFYRPWQSVCGWLRKYEPRIEAEKQRLSPLAGAWKKAEEERAERVAREEAEAAAAAERRQLEADAERARAAAAQTVDAPEATKLVHVAEILEHAATQVQPVTMPVRSLVPASGGTKGKTKWVGQIVDADLFYKGLGDGTIPRTFVEVKQGTLDSQATDLKAELEKRYPGLRAAEVPGIASKGRR